MKNLLTFILIHLVDHPESVVVHEEHVNDTDVYTISVHPEDIGKVIGKHGSCIQSIRTLAKVRAMKEQRRINIQISEDTPTAPVEE